MTRRRRLAAALLAAAAAGAGGGYAAARSSLKARLTVSVGAYGLARAAVVASALRQSGRGYVLVAGDSHAELAAPDAPSCGRKLVNAGLSGAKADDYATFLSAVSAKAGPAPRAAVAVVTLGTNHLLRKRNPAGKEAADRYEADLETVVRALSAMADRVVVAAVPPLMPSQDPYVDRAGAANLTARQASVCRRAGCETADPYAYARDADFGTARAGSSSDGLHLSDYRPAYAALDAVLCR